MIERSNIEQLAERLVAVMPTELKLARNSLREAFMNTLKSGIDKMDLVTREEFDVQAKILARTREKLERLEQHVTNLEHRD